LEEEPGQNWGITAAASPRTHPAVKNGWLPAGLHGQWVINGIGVIIRAGHQLLIAVLSDGQPTHNAGIAQAQAAARAAASAITSMTTRSDAPAPEEGMMNDSTRVMRRPRQARPIATRTAAAIIATAALALLAAACSGSPSSTGSGGSPNAAGPTSAGGSTDTPSAVAYSHCVRSHGVPNYPDPGSDGQIPKGNAQHFGVSSSQLQTAQSACQHLLPATGAFAQQARQCFSAGDCPAALVQQILTAERKFAQCMRSHGVSNWPDPSLDSEGRPIFNLVPVGITHSEVHSPPIATKMTECQRLDPAPGAMAA